MNLSQDGLWLIATGQVNGIVGTFTVSTEKQK